MTFKIKKNKSLSIALRGYGNHCKKLLKAIESCGYNLDLVFLPRSIEAWKDIGEKDQIDACLITSPNSTHLLYAEAAIGLFNFAHIYCEKPYVNCVDDIKKAHDLIDTGRITLGFNLRFSIFQDTINRLIEQHDLGPIIGIEISVCYPFALRSSYSESWKSDPTYSPLGVVENLAVHYIDLLNYIWKVKSISETSSVNVNSLPTTTNIIAKLGNGSTANMHFSYSESYNMRVVLSHKGGKIVFDENTSKVYAPVLNLDPKTNMSVPPELVYSDENGIEQIFAGSLVIAMKYFAGRICGEPKDPIMPFSFNHLKDHEYIDIMAYILQSGAL